MTCNLVATPGEWIPILANDAELLHGLLRSASEAHFDALYADLERRLPPEADARIRARRDERSSGAKFANNPILAAAFARDKAAKDRFRERFGSSPPVLGLEKNWDVLNYVLTRAVAARGGDVAVAAFLVTGAAIGDKVDLAPARVHSPEGVRQIAETLAPLDSEQMAAQLDFEEMAQQRVYPIRDAPTGDERDAWVKTVEGSGAYLLEFIEKTASNGQALLIDMS